MRDVASSGNCWGSGPGTVEHHYRQLGEQRRLALGPAQENCVTRCLWTTSSRGKVNNGLAEHCEIGQLILHEYLSPSGQQDVAVRIVVQEGKALVGSLA